MGGHQLLVGTDHALASLQGTLGEVQGSAYAADGLHHHIDLGIVLNDLKVLHEVRCEGTVREIPHVQDIFQLDKIVCFLSDASAVTGDDLCHTRANNAKT